MRVMGSSWSSGHGTPVSLSHRRIAQSVPAITILPSTAAAVRRSRIGGWASVTEWPRSDNASAVTATAEAASGESGPKPPGTPLHTPTRSDRGMTPSDGCTANGSPGSGPETAPSRPAVSRTDRVTASSAITLPKRSPYSGPRGTRPRLGLSPTSPQRAAGERIDPPASLA